MNLTDASKRIAAAFHLPEIPLPHLEEALTHRSYAVENHLNCDNQRLEYLGDAVVEIVLSDDLFRRYPDADEGLMTKLRAAQVCEPALAKLARNLRLGEMLKIGHGEAVSGGGDRDSTLADLFEAVIGAIYLDTDFETIRGALLELFHREWPDAMQLLAANNPKGELQELTQQKWGVVPTYTLLAVSGPAHQPNFDVEAAVGPYTAPGRAASRKLAECEAAKRLYNYLTLHAKEVK